MAIPPQPISRLIRRMIRGRSLFSKSRSASNYVSMTERAGRALTLRSAPLVHMVLVASSLAVVGGFWFLRGGIPIALLPTLRSPMSYAGYALSALVLVVTSGLRSRIPDLERGIDVEVWWSANRSRVLALWAIGDMACVAGSALWFLTDNQLVLLTLGGAGLMVLALHRPSKLLEVT